MCFRNIIFTSMDVFPIQRDYTCQITISIKQAAAERRNGSGPQNLSSAILNQDQDDEYECYFSLPDLPSGCQKA